MAGGETLSRSARSNPSVTRQPLPCSVPRVLSLPYSRRALSCPLPRVAGYPPVENRFPSSNSNGESKGWRKKKRRERRDDTWSHRRDQQVNSSQSKIETIGEFPSGVLSRNAM